MDNATLAALRLLINELARNGALPDASLDALNSSYRDCAKVLFERGDEAGGEALIELSTLAHGLRVLNRTLQPRGDQSPDSISSI